MKTLLWAERIKLRRSKIIWIALFSAVMVSVIVYMQGQFLFQGHRYVDEAGWFMTAAQSLGSIYVLPAIIALMGSYMICREEQDDTMKSLRLIPVKPSSLVGAKLILAAVMSVLLYAFLFIITFSTEAALHFSLLKAVAILNFLKIYLLQGICLFLAMSPIIAIVAVLKKGYWIALIFAEVYSFAGLFVGMQNTARFIYPVTAAFCVSGYYESTLSQLATSILSLLACALISLLILSGLNRKHSS